MTKGSSSGLRLRIRVQPRRLSRTSNSRRYQREEFGNVLLRDRVVVREYQQRRHRQPCDLGGTLPRQLSIQLRTNTDSGRLMLTIR
jgi:hypothetical protein